jgi:Uma2 family endonuclease
MRSGRTFTECPISTADGVKAADVAWASAETMRARGNYACFPRAPEICVEILSPSNTKAEIAEKMALYFDAAAREVWICSGSGVMTFYRAALKKPATSSELCPRFPKKVILPDP